MVVSLIAPIQREHARHRSQALLRVMLILIKIIVTHITDVIMDLIVKLL